MNQLEVYKSAIMMERHGKAFYEHVASMTESDAVRNIFAFMAKEEQLHLEQLSIQYAHYMRNNTFLIKEFPLGDTGFVAKMLTKDICNQINAASFEAAAISAAIDFESKAVDVYSQAAKNATDVAQKAIFTWLSEWEKGHHRILNQLNAELREAVWYDNKFWPF